MGSSKNESLTQTSVRLYTDDMSKLKKMAREDDRDVAYEIRKIVHDYLEAVEV